MNTRKKGQILETYVCDQIRAKGLDDHVRPAFNSGATNTEKADIWTSLMILDQNIGIECKNQKTLCIPDWWKQTKKLESLGREPVLVFKIFLEPLGETKALIYLDTFLEMAKEIKMLKDKLKNSDSTKSKRKEVAGVL
jgi:hypothetical protein